MIRFILTALITLFIPIATYAHTYLEKEYQQVWCTQNNGQMELVLPDGARVDCVTDTHAIEFDFANKWAESIGQSLYYSLITGKAPGVVLILEQPKKEQRYVRRLETVAKKTGIKVWYMCNLQLEK